MPSDAAPADYLVARRGELERGGLLRCSASWEVADWTRRLVPVIRVDCARDRPLRSPSVSDRPHRRAGPATKALGPWSLIQIMRPAIVASGLCRGCGRGQCVGSALRDGAAAAREQRPNDEGLWPSKFSWWLGEQGTRFCRKRWPPTMRAVVRGLIGTALFRWFVGFSSTPKPCTVAFAILRNVPELARWTSRPLLEFGRGTFCSHVSGFPASHTAIVSVSTQLYLA